MTDNTLLLEKLSKHLDRESRVIKCWKHLAYVLNVPAEETRKFDMYTEHSPTEDMFNYLADTWRPDLTVKELKVKLKAVHRNDVIDSLNEGIQHCATSIISANIQFIVYCYLMINHFCGPATWTWQGHNLISNVLPKYNLHNHLSLSFLYGSSRHLL